jgi:hypothetical protein
MRKFVITCAAAAGLIAVAAFASLPAQALSGAAPAGLSGAVEETSPVELVRHRRWHRYHRYHRWGYYHRPYWGYHRPYWGYHRRWWY